MHEIAAARSSIAGSYFRLWSRAARLSDIHATDDASSSSRQRDDADTHGGVADVESTRAEQQ